MRDNLPGMAYLFRAIVVVYRIPELERRGAAQILKTVDLLGTNLKFVPSRDDQIHSDPTVFTVQLWRAW